MKGMDVKLRKIKLQAHMGVASECPENTMSAFRRAMAQGYDVIELDLGYTLDKKIVVIHDDTINRTARHTDGSVIEDDIKINDITYSEALKFDFGIYYSNKYQGEPIPLFNDVLELAEASGIRLKIDNKIQRFSDEMLEVFFEEISAHSKLISITSNDIDFIKKCTAPNSDVSIDYDGEVTEKILTELCEIVPRERLTVWLPFKCAATSWVKIPFADRKLSQLVKKYAKSGIWLIKDQESFESAVAELKPDIVETDGTVKPVKNVGICYDMHTHSENSHDSQCRVTEMHASACKKGVGGFAVTDHCDIEYYATQDLDAVVNGSIADAVSKNGENGIEVLRGIEMGEAIWYKDIADGILSRYSFDVVIGSVHAVRMDGYTEPYSKLDFGKMGRQLSEKYLDTYFDDLLEMLKRCDIDVLAHLTCPLRYINGKYGLGVSLDGYYDKIKNILSYIIKHGIALELNTSCIYEGSGYNELLPEWNIVLLYRSMGGQLITLGSDAHIFQKLASEFDALLDKVKAAGFKNIYFYRDRMPIQCSLSGQF